MTNIKIQKINFELRIPGLFRALAKTWWQEAGVPPANSLLAPFLAQPHPRGLTHVNATDCTLT